MDRMRRAVILTELMNRLRSSGSWCAETHVQKAVYFLQELLGVEAGFEYIFYKHGPYSFELTEDLMALRADYLLGLDYRSPGYGPGLVPTENSAQLRGRFPKTVDGHRRQIEFVASAFGAKGVAELEKLATALYVTRKLPDTNDVSTRARRVHELKPHITLEAADAAVRQFDEIARAACADLPRPADA